METMTHLRAGARYAAAVDELLDAYIDLAASEDLSLTKENRALAYKAARDKVMARAEALVKLQVDRLAHFQNTTEASAMNAAGIATDTPYGAEIRDTLRRMTPDERDAAINE